MPFYVRFISRYGNGLVIILFGLMALAMLFGRKSSLTGTLVFALPAAMCTFNLWTLRRAAQALSEEEWLKSEVRKAELRRRLHDMAMEDATRRPPPMPVLSLPATSSSTLPADRSGGSTPD
ncbi:hypothetical protein ABIE65_003844 [Constrictibacter sp. MBR-5]|jgi:hypothetical protein|uniref:hypothetical protein n=1 Tax=Constrictibacter sp. MBR-5 TaxID=3156467 RepID=UPI003392BEFB